MQRVVHFLVPSCLIVVLYFLKVKDEIWASVFHKKLMNWRKEVLPIWEQLAYRPSLLDRYPRSFLDLDQPSSSAFPSQFLVRSRIPSSPYILTIEFVQISLNLTYLSSIHTHSCCHSIFTRICYNETDLTKRSMCMTFGDISIFRKNFIASYTKSP